MNIPPHFPTLNSDDAARFNECLVPLLDRHADRVLEVVQNVIGRRFTDRETDAIVLELDSEAHTDAESASEPIDIPSDYWNRGARLVLEAKRRMPELHVMPGDFLFVRPGGAARPGEVVVTGAGAIRRLGEIEPADVEILGVVLGRSGEVRADHDAGAEL